MIEESSSPGEFHPQALTGRVEDWRGTPKPVSSPRLVKPGVRFSRTGLSWMLRAKGYGTYQAESAFGCGWKP